MSTTVPQELGGRYEIGALLGRGGMAEVHLGRDSRLGRAVAVKMLRPDLARDPSFQARFRREAHSAASLNHPSVAAVYDTGEDQYLGNPVPYIVMEYVEGSTLRDLMSSGNRLVPERALEIVDGVLEALAYSHAQGIVHRDIKPANVMLTPSGAVKVMDFGIARAMDDMGATMTQTSAVIGTAQYLSPEQARGQQVDARSDLYSTGCLLYELLTGRPPFVGDSPVSVAYQHVRENPVPPSQLDPDVPTSVDAIVLKALAKEREQRYQSADEMRRDIAAALAGRPVAAVVPPPQPTQPIQSTTVLPGTSTIPAVGAHAAEPNKKGRTLGYVLLGIAVLAVFVVAALIARSALGGSGADQVQVPDVTGLSVAEASAALKAEGLTLGTQTQQASDTVPEGRVIDQSPESDTQVDQGRRRLGDRVERRRGDRRPVAGRALARPGVPGAAPGGARGRSHDLGGLRPDPQHRAQGQPQGGRDRAGRQQRRHPLRQRQQQGARRGRQGRGHRPEPARAGRVPGADSRRAGVRRPVAGHRAVPDAGGRRDQPARLDGADHGGRRAARDPDTHPSGTDGHRARRRRRPPPAADTGAATRRRPAGRVAGR